MKSRLLRLCLLAYPGASRERDGGYLRDLALELAKTSGVRRQALSLIRGGLLERVRGVRRRAGLVAGAAVATLVVGGVAVADRGSVQIEEEIAAEPDPAAAPIERFIDRALPEDASGTLVAMRGHRVVACEGFGLVDHAARVPASCDTVYDIGSLTKQFTAAAVVKLEMLGRLDVHDTIGSWLGPVPPDKAGITVQQLLTHTAGLVDALGDDYQRLTRRQLVMRALASPLISAPGTAYHYSNVGYSLLAVIIERASGLSYERFLARHLFRPARMTQTGYTQPHWRHFDVAVEYDARGRPQGRPFDHPWAASGPWWNLRGNGGLLSTARDLARWHRALLDHQVLDRHAQRELFRPRVLERPGGDSWYGYGWVLRDTPVGPVAWHNGGNGWSYAELTRVLGRGLMLFWVTNQARSIAGGWNLERLATRLTAGVVRRLIAGPPRHK
jgi:CubicO group peptidase (beta-lactamase class C family)